MEMNEDKTQRMGGSLAALHTRIARLAMALDLNLEDRAVVEALIETPQIVPVALERRSNPEHAGAPSVGVGSERRKSHKREELRGLLALRYHLETVSLNDNGAVLTHQVLAVAEDHLVRQGFKPGAAGFNLSELLTP
jgi:hypothetical protein